MCLECRNSFVRLNNGKKLYFDEVGCESISRVSF